MARVDNIEEFTAFNAVNNAEKRNLGNQAEMDAYPGLSGIPSKAAIQGHPVHPILVTMPIAMLVMAFVSDWVHTYTYDRFWSRASRYLLAGGLLTGMASAVVGFVDFFAIGRVRAVKDGWIHMIGNAVALLLTWFNWRMRHSDDKHVPPTGRTLSTVVALLLGLTGWFGGQLIYQHKVAVNETDSEPWR